MPLRPACLDILLSALGRGPFGRNRLSLARSCSSALLYWVGARTMLASACHETLLLELALYLGSSQKTEKIVRLASNRQVEAIDPDAVASGNIKINPNLTLLAGHG